MLLEVDIAITNIYFTIFANGTDFPIQVLLI